MPFIDPANPSPWLASLRASRRRRAEAAQHARRRRAGRGGARALLAAMTLVAGAAVAADDPSRAAAQTASASGVVALQRALGVSADGVIGPVTRRAIRNYQRNQGLAVDGVAGPATLGSLGIAASPRRRRRPRRRRDRRRHGSATLAKIARASLAATRPRCPPAGGTAASTSSPGATWRDLGGSGDPAAAPESVQDAMAAKLLAQRGTTPGRSAG